MTIWWLSILENLHRGEQCQVQEISVNRSTHSPPRTVSELSDVSIRSVEISTISARNASNVEFLVPFPQTGFSPPPEPILAFLKPGAKLVKIRNSQYHNAVPRNSYGVR